MTWSRVGVVMTATLIAAVQTTHAQRCTLKTSLKPRFSNAVLVSITPQSVHDCNERQRVHLRRGYDRMVGGRGTEIRHHYQAGRGRQERGRRDWGTRDPHYTHSCLASSPLAAAAAAHRRPFALWATLGKKKRKRKPRSGSSGFDNPRLVITSTATATS